MCVSFGIECTLYTPLFDKTNGTTVLFPPASAVEGIKSVPSVRPSVCQSVSEHSHGWTVWPTILNWVKCLQNMRHISHVLHHQNNETKGRGWLSTIRCYMTWDLLLITTHTDINNLRSPAQSGLLSDTFDVPIKFCVYTYLAYFQTGIAKMQGLFMARPYVPICTFSFNVYESTYTLYTF